jgi:adenine phosphoribosyltransferase
MKTISDYIRTIPDFPHEGIMFRDVTTLFADPVGYRLCIDQLTDACHNFDADKVVGLEARGFILGGAVADRLGLGFVPIRKAGKLPGTVLAQDYTLEYGQATLEIHDDALQPGERVLLIDDLLATGGTAKAGIQLVERLGAQVVFCAFIIDLPELGGSRLLQNLGIKTRTLCAFSGA